MYFHRVRCWIFNCLNDICHTKSHHSQDHKCLLYIPSLDLAPKGIIETWSCQYTSSWLWPEGACVFGGLLVMTDWWAGFLNSTDWVITRKCSEQALIGPRLWNFGSHWLWNASWMILLCEVVIRLTRAASNTWSSVKWHTCAHMYFGFVDCQLLLKYSLSCCCYSNIVPLDAYHSYVGAIKA